MCRNSDRVPAAHLMTPGCGPIPPWATRRRRDGLRPKSTPRLIQTIAISGGLGGVSRRVWRQEGARGGCQRASPFDLLPSGRFGLGGSSAAQTPQIPTTFLARSVGMVAVIPTNVESRQTVVPLTLFQEPSSRPGTSAPDFADGQFHFFSFVKCFRVPRGFMAGFQRFPRPNWSDPVRAQSAGPCGR